MYIWRGEDHCWVTWGSWYRLGPFSVSKSSPMGFTLCSWNPKACVKDSLHDSKKIVLVCMYMNIFETSFNSWTTMHFIAYQMYRYLWIHFWIPGFVGWRFKTLFEGSQEFLCWWVLWLWGKDLLPAIQKIYFLMIQYWWK